MSETAVKSDQVATIDNQIAPEAAPGDAVSIRLFLICKYNPHFVGARCE